MKKIFNIFKSMWQSTEPYPLVEGKYADEYRCPELQKMIREEYNKRFEKKDNPYTNPTNYDPFSPPEGWRYDPYYQEWIKLR